MEQPLCPALGHLQALKMVQIKTALEKMARRKPTQDNPVRDIQVYFRCETEGVVGACKYTAKGDDQTLEQEPLPTPLQQQEY